MRKKFLATLLCLLSLCTYGYAQKGMQSVGLNVSYNDDIDLDDKDHLGIGDGYRGFSIGAKYQYYLTNYIRLSPTVKYVSMEDSQFENSYFYDSDYYHQLEIPSYVTWEHEKVSMQGIDVSLDIHWFFTKVRRIRSYFITGLSTGYLKAEFVSDYHNYYWEEHSIYTNKSCYQLSEGHSNEVKKNHLEVNVGIGINWEIIPALSLQTEFIYRYGSGEDYDKSLDITYRPFEIVQFTTGLSYNF